MNALRRVLLGRRDTRSNYEHAFLVFLFLCPRVKHPIVCGIHRLPCNFNDPQHADISWFTSHRPPIFIWNQKILPTCLLCDQYVVSWNEATGFNMILWDQIAPFDPRHDSSDLLYPTGSSVHMHITSRNTGNGEEICDRKNNTVPLQGCVC